MALIEATMIELIKQKIESNVSSTDSTVQFKIPTDVFPLSVIYHVLDSIQECYSLDTNKKVIIKIASQAFQYWEESGNGEKEIITRINENHRAWVDTRGNLTFYRNALATSQDKDIQQILILVGGDKVNDQASLEHIPSIGIHEIWTQGMNSSFISWIKETAKDTGHADRLQDDRSLLYDCDALLKIVLLYTDQLVIAGYLEALPIESDLENGFTLFDSIAMHLDKLQLGSCLTVDRKKARWKSDLQNVLTQTYSLYSGHIALENAKYSRCLKSVQDIYDTLATEEFDTKKLSFLNNQAKVYPTFESPESYIEACMSVLKRNADDATIEKLRQCDSLSLVNKVLKYKASKKKTKTSDTEVFGNPFEMVLSALWDSLALYTRSEFHGFEEISLIRIEPINFYHNVPAADINSNVVVGDQYEFIFEEKLLTLLGGIDEVLNNRVISELKESFSPEFNFISLLGDKNCYIGITTAKPASTPALQFIIWINEELSTKYIWKIPDTNAYTISGNLVKVIDEQISLHRENVFLPAFKIHDFQEVFSMLSEDDMRESFLSSIGRSKETIIENLLDNLPNESLNSDHYIRFSSLGSIAVRFYNTYAKHGLYYVLESAIQKEFVNSYSALLDSVVDEAYEYDDLFFPLLTSAFWMIDYQLLRNDSWKYDGYLKAGIISLLHPAMVEMLHSQMAFLADSFIDQFMNAKHLLDNKGRMTLRMWNRSIELATLQSPIPCLLINRSNISTRVRGEEVFYRIGIQTGSLDDTVLLTRFRMVNEDDYDTISDSALTREGEESALLKRLLSDYFHVYALAQDGINIAVFKNFNIQPIIASLITLVKEVVPQGNDAGDRWYDEYPFSLNVTFYSDTSDDSGISNWINRWQDYWEIKTQTDIRFLRCKLIISHRMLEINGNGQNAASFESMISGELDTDISILYEMPMGDSGNTNLIRIPKLPDNEVAIKFPLLEKLAQRRIGFKTNFRRSRILSNRQFRVYRAFLRYLYAMKLHEFGSFAESEIIINEERDFSKWKKTLDWCHEKSERVICIGGEIDKDLITDSESESEGPEPIVVGFGSGVGSHAELNYTVSCKVDKNETLFRQLSASFKNIYTMIPENKAETIVKNLYQQSKRMADLSLVRTIGTTDYYKHDYFGYTLARRLLKISDDSYDCDVVLALDSYRHWFHEEICGKRADLLWLRAKQVPNGPRMKYELDLTIIEVKMGFNVEHTHLDKAIKQVQATIPVLTKHFATASTTISPDSRYWWMQLYRIIATNPRKHSNLAKNGLECLESLAEGVFEINWDANIFCFDGNDLPDGEKVALRYCRFDDVSIEACGVHGCDAYIFSPAFVEEFGGTNDASICDWEEQKAKLEASYVKKDHDFDLFQAQSQDKEESDDDIRFDFEDDTQQANDQCDIDGIDKSYDGEELIERGNILYSTDDLPVSEAAEEKDPYHFDHQSSIADFRVLIGTTKQGRSVHWDFGSQGQIVNRHMFILGGSGSGKTYAIQGMLAELAKSRQASLIIDYTNGFTMNQVENEVKAYMRKQWYVANKKLSFNPFLAYTLQIDPDDPDSFYTDQPVNIAQRIVDVFIRVYGSIGENQISILTDTIEAGIKTNKGNYSLTKLYDDLQSRSDDQSVKSSIVGLLNKFGVLLKMDPFGTEESDIGWNEIYGSEGQEQITVFQLAQIAPYVQKIIIEFSLWDLWNHVIAMKATQNSPRVVVLDEIQNLSLSESSPVRKYLQEGRKLGLSLIAATQSFAGMKGINSPEMNSLMNAGTKLFFRPTDQEIPSVAKLIYNFDSTRSEADWRSELGKLGKGQCIVVINNGTNRKQNAMIVNVPSMKERGI